MNSFSSNFLNKFDFYIDSFDVSIKYQSKIGLTEKELSSLSELDQNLVKSYLFFAESSNTTIIGVLRLLSSNLYSDAYSLVRILYEIACLMHYGNISKDNKIEVYRTIFKSNLSEDEHQKNEWKLIKKSETFFEKEKPGLVPIRKELNNFGGHISRKKIVLGNITAIGNSSASTLFTNNFNNRYLLAGLDFVHCMFNLILEEYSQHLIEYNGVDDRDLYEIKKLSQRFLTNIRPRLQSFMKP